MLVIKISVNAGHTATGSGYGAEYKGFRESEINHAVVKDGGNLYVVKKTYAKAILVELFFLDNYTDRKLYLELGPDKIAQAIAEAIGK